MVRHRLLHPTTTTLFRTLRHHHRKHSTTHRAFHRHDTNQVHQLLVLYYPYRHTRHHILQRMEALNDILIQYGYWGMLVSAFLAGSFFPFSSEAVMLGLLAAGLAPTDLVIYGSIGNVAGSLFNYGVGRMGKTEWIERYLHVSQESLDKAERFMAGRGAWMGFFAFLPVLGSAITIMLGLMRANLPISILSITIGKVLRYVLLLYGISLIW